MDYQIKDSQPFSPALRESRVRAKTAGSLERWQRARGSLAGGVFSGLRRSAFPHPLYFTHGRAATLHDVDGNTYIDYTLGWGPNILGNAPAEVIEAVCESIQNGLTFGAQHDLEYEVAEMLTRIIPCADRVCFANSGTEIVQVALRLARAATGRSKFLKFEGHYHGWDDSVLQSYHPSIATCSPPTRTNIAISCWPSRMRPYCRCPMAAGMSPPRIPTTILRPRLKPSAAR